ncbi:hypothetical protein CANCADRAFT_20166, partial [Tortispora caseinolytica NRRL Y-17796]
KRRMPYSLGNDPLEKQDPPATPSADSFEELSRDINVVYSNLLPSNTVLQNRIKFTQKIQKILASKWPQIDLIVKPFGSSENLLSTSDSDVDLCIITSHKEIEDICELCRTLNDAGMERIICISRAKVPIAKFWDPEFNVACDINFNNTMALQNTYMIKTYVQTDPRVRILALVIKHWTKLRALNDAAFGATLSSYTWLCLIIGFLQLRTPPLIPSLHKIAANNAKVSTNLKSIPKKHPELWHTCVKDACSEFCDDLAYLQPIARRNKQSLGELLYQFFEFYGYKFPYGSMCISVRTGKMISKSNKGWHLMQNNSFCVEEPFNISRNIGNTADEISVKGLQLEFRRACQILSASGDLSQVLEPYEFP